MIFFYRFLINIIFILSPFIVLLRLANKKEDFKRFKEKYGFFKKRKSNGKVIWFHGASVGEIQSIIPILEKLQNDRKINKILITSNTLSSSKIISKVKIEKLVHQFFPIDTNFLTNKFINHWQPSLALFIDSEIWPNMLLNLNKNKIPTVLINARITKKSYNRWIKLKKFSKKIFNCINISLCSNKETAKYLRELGCKKIKYFGNLKFAQSESESIKIENQIVKFISKKTVWCASSTHYNEEKFIGKAHKVLKKKIKNLLTVIIPRHIHREDQIKEELTKLGLNIHVHKPKKKIDINTDVYLVNTFGETKSFYSLIKNIFLGGSLINHGGQNPLEAARYGCNILHGPNVQNFSEVYQFLNKQNISKKIYSYNQTANHLEKLIYSKKEKKKFNKKIKIIGKKILKKNIKEIYIILNHNNV